MKVTDNVRSEGDMDSTCLIAISPVHVFVISQNHRGRSTMLLNIRPVSILFLYFHFPVLIHTVKLSDLNLEVSSDFGLLLRNSPSRSMNLERVMKPASHE